MSDTNEELQVARQAAFDGVKTRAQGIQELLKAYAENNKCLQDDVQGFMSRDDAEQERLDQLTLAVAQSEMDSMQDPAFLSFSKKWQGARQSEARTRPTVQRDATDPKSYPRCEWAASLTHWLRLHPVYPCKPNAKPSWSLPSCVLSLGSYPTLYKGLLAWGAGDDSAVMRAELSTLLQGLFDMPCSEESNDVGAIAAEEPHDMVCLFNGFLLTPAGGTYTGAVRGAGQEDVVRTYQAYCNHVIAESTTSKVALSRTLLDMATKHQRRNASSNAASADSVSPTGPSVSGGRYHRAYRNNAAPLLIGDWHDTIILTSARSLLHTQTFRAFFFGAQLLAVEHIGAEVDVLPLYSTDICCGPSDVCDEHASREEAARQEAKERICRALVEVHSACLRCSGSSEQANAFEHTVAVIAAITTLHHDGSPFRALVLDIRPASPSLPFMWHVSWSDLCALGQVHKQDQAQHRAASCQTLFKLTELSVASLKPCDALSAEVFPLLNKVLAQRNCSRAEGTDPSTGSDASVSCMRQRGVFPFTSDLRRCHASDVTKAALATLTLSSLAFALLAMKRKTP